MALLAAALFTVAREHETLAGALDAVRRPSLWRVGLLAAAVAANVVLTALMFSVLISRYGRVAAVEMQALVAAAALLNFLPLRPGLFGRIAYHRAFNAIPAVATVKTVLQAAGLSVAVAAYLALALLVSARLPVPLWVPVGLPVPLLGAAAAMKRARIWAVAGLIRYLEIMVWALRYFVAFALIGAPIDPQGALAFACLSVVPMLVPFVGNGLGLREWAVGLAAPLLTPYVLGLGLAAELLNRAAELVVIVILGLGGIAWLTLRARRNLKSEI
ncbi:MAG: hypothetical protein ACYS1B_13460 [Planctomycetota bacterium]|jgi:hypothetical protein